MAILLLIVWCLLVNSLIQELSLAGGFKFLAAQIIMFVMMGWDGVI